MGSRRQGSSEFGDERRIDSFIGVEKQNPGVFERMILQRPIAFFGMPAVPLELEHRGTRRVGKIDRAIRAAGVNHDHFVKVCECR